MPKFYHSENSLSTIKYFNIYLDLAIIKEYTQTRKGVI